MINLIVARSYNQCIGKNNTIPWKCKEDLQYFKEKTFGHIVIMGRKTFESLGNKPLKNRVNIVISSSLKNEDVIVCDSIESAIETASDISNNQEIFLIGGKSIYDYVIQNDLVDRIYLNVIKQVVEGDIFFDFHTEPYKMVGWKNFDGFEAFVYDRDRVLFRNNKQ